MNLSRRWLTEFVDTTHIPDKEFIDRLTMSGSKVETLSVTGSDVSGVVVGKVLSIERHPDSDHMFICQVDVGAGAPVQIVTGAQNVREGDLVVVLEAMKMEQPLTAHKSGTVSGLTAVPGATVSAGAVIASILD